LPGWLAELWWWSSASLRAVAEPPLFWLALPQLLVEATAWRLAPLYLPPQAWLLDSPEPAWRHQQVSLPPVGRLCRLWARQPFAPQRDWLALSRSLLHQPP